MSSNKCIYNENDTDKHPIPSSYAIEFNEEELHGEEQSKGKFLRENFNETRENYHLNEDETKNQPISSLPYFC